MEALCRPQTSTSVLWQGSRLLFQTPPSSSLRGDLTQAFTTLGQGSTIGLLPQPEAVSDKAAKLSSI